MGGAHSDRAMRPAPAVPSRPSPGISLLKSIIVQTYIQTQREDSKQKMNKNEKTLAWTGKSNNEWKIKFCTKFLKTLSNDIYVTYIIIFIRNIIKVQNNNNKHLF